MPFARKVLWVVDYDGNEQLFKDQVKASGCDTVCIRTRSLQLPQAIADFKALGKTVWAWRWPGVDDDLVIEQKMGPHYFAPREANFVADLIKNHRLDGYVVDPESEQDKGVNDWDQITTNKGFDIRKLAVDFCKTIKDAAADKKFLFGFTSGNIYPDSRKKFPWDVFVGASDALYPQSYWRVRKNDGSEHEPFKDLFGPGPEPAIDGGIASWKKISQGKPIHPMAGELDGDTDKEIGRYSAKLAALNIKEGNFYATVPKDKINPGVSDDVLKAIRES
jgi:hypothetical protein